MSSELLVEKLAKALYDSHRYAKDWYHPKINPAWQPMYRDYAKLALGFCMEEAAKCAENYRPTFRLGEPMFANIAAEIRAFKPDISEEVAVVGSEKREDESQTEFVIRQIQEEERERFKRELAKRLAPLYKGDEWVKIGHLGIATLCDEVLDPTGNLLGFVREEASRST